MRSRRGRSRDERRLKVLVATRSAGKLRELRGILEEAGMTGITLDDAGIAESRDEDAIECYATFEENALAKARYFHRKSGMPTLADDSGLRVDALDGAPGVWSKRFSGRSDLSGQELDDANNAKLLSELRGQENRSASYACAAAWVNGSEEHFAIGETSGRIVDEPGGDNGFGYDPYFFSNELRKTFGDATIAEKQVASHRGRAFRSLIAALRGRWSTGC
jgi:XTP/dITP diphosphohydrolase